ncbi:GNAT family N-acetyltransferase [Rhodococcus sp. NPDC127528]|uniref:GNAT family N-acetyltransferase n=1 Tax=unclassified Rhodococcus (in: high G+C Gram-positive bacteria) TaxID=192944 RepID=UPI003629FFB6
MPTSDPAPFTPVPDPRPTDVPWPQMLWPIPGGTELRGSWVRLTTLDPAADAADLFRALDRDRVWAHVPWRPADPESFEEFLRVRSTEPGWHQWTVRTVRPVGGLPAGSAVGTTAYLDVAPRDARLEIGMTLYHPGVWSTAVNPEAKLLLLRHAFENLNVGRVQLKTDVRNTRSQQAIARLGARYEGTLRRSFRREDGTVRDSVLFSITVDDWPAVRDRLTRRLEVSAESGPA